MGCIRPHCLRRSFRVLSVPKELSGEARDSPANRARQLHQSVRSPRYPCSVVHVDPDA